MSLLEKYNTLNQYYLYIRKTYVLSSLVQPQLGEEIILALGLRRCPLGQEVRE